MEIIEVMLSNQPTNYVESTIMQQHFASKGFKREFVDLYSRASSSNDQEHESRSASCVATPEIVVYSTWLADSQSNGIEFKYYCPYTNQQNGLVKRHKHIVEMRLTFTCHNFNAFTIFMGCICLC